MLVVREAACVILRHELCQQTPRNTHIVVHTSSSWYRPTGAVPLKTCGFAPSRDTEKSPWFVEVQPYTDIALPVNMTDADALAVFVRLC